MRGLALAAAMLFASAAWALGPFEKNHPLVDEGTRAYDAQKFDEALAKYDEALKEKPRDARLHYNRGLALHKLGKHEEARTALEQARQLDTDGSLRGRAHYALGNVAAALNQKKDAVREYRKALRADPKDELARHNLEVMLRDLPPQTPSPGDGGTPDGGQQDGGRPDGGGDAGVDGGSDAGRPDGGTGDGGQGDGGSDGGGDGGSDGGADGGSQGDGGQGDGGEGDGGKGDKPQDGDGGSSSDSQPSDAGSDAGSGEADAGTPDGQPQGESADAGADISKKEAEKLLDSIKSGEKNLQLWRFKQRTQRNDSNGKDW